MPVREMPDAVDEKYNNADMRNISELSHFLSDYPWKRGPCHLNSAQI